jgi:hypothetical protein
MSLSILSYLFATERIRSRGSTGAGFSIPAMSEREVPDGLDPILVTNAHGRFVFTKKNREGMARFGIFPCSLEEEPVLLSALACYIQGVSIERAWSNHFESVGAAVEFMRGSRFKPKSLVLPRGVVSRFTDSEGVALGSIEGIKLLSTDIPNKFAILTTDAPSLGVYIRVGDYVGLQLYNVDKTLAVIESYELG